MISRAFFCRLAAALLLLGLSVGAPAQNPVEQSLLGMRQLDARVASIGHRLATSNLDFCRERQWLPGLMLHDLSQYGASYRAAAIRAFRLDRGPAVLALAAGGPAEQAGVRLDDVLLSLDGQPFPRSELTAEHSFEQMERILGALEAAFADGKAVVRLDRAGSPLTLEIRGQEGCASRFQLIPSRRLNALADGRYVQVTTAIAGYVQDDQELAAVLAHEFAHNVLRHRVRLDEAGVERGFLGNFGRNARRIRETEVEADRLSVYLVERAGYDPEAAVRFWSRFGRRGLNFLGSPTHPNWRRRMAMMDAEIQTIRQARSRGASPLPDFLNPACAGADCRAPGSPLEPGR